jgi:hypothetical protein
VLKSEVLHLFASPIISFERCAGGGNSKIYKVEDAKGKKYALKVYPPMELDPRDRLGTEYLALDFLSRSSKIRVPKPISMDRQNLLAAYEWIDGNRAPPSAEIIDAMLDFIRVVHPLRKTKDAQAIPLASECCLSGADILKQVRARITRLKLLFGDTELQDFLSTAVEPMLATLKYADVPLPAGHWCLTPGDFGSHNMLVSIDGIAFVDMEYFGWDDPVKQVCDVMWHPGMNLSDELASRFLLGAQIVYASNDSGFNDRVKSFFPAYGLRWITIILNEFLPERWALRAHTGMKNQLLAKEIQLEKAKALFLRLNERQTMVNKLINRTSSQK